MHAKLRMTPTEIFLRHNVFLAHCSSFAKMVGNKDTEALAPFEKLDRILEDYGNPNIEVSCSTIGLSDTLIDNYFTGEFGLILKPDSFSSITHISNSDGGTEPSGDGRTRKGTNRINSVQTLDDAIINRGSAEDRTQNYNEICVNYYEILGLFISQNSNLHDLLNHFKGRVRLLHLKCDGSELKDLFNGKRVSIQELYNQGE